MQRLKTKSCTMFTHAFNVFFSVLLHLFPVFQSDVKGKIKDMSFGSSRYTSYNDHVLNKNIF